MAKHPVPGDEDLLLEGSVLGVFFGASPTFPGGDAISLGSLCSHFPVNFALLVDMRRLLEALHEAHRQPL